MAPKKKPVKSSAGFKLPLSMVGRPDVMRIIRELEELDNQLTQNRIKGVTAKINYSPSLSAIAADNKLDMSKAKVREDLKEHLVDIRDRAPEIHVSFAVEPPSEVVAKILLWFRREIDTRLLISVGVQPGIAAGLVVRTQNRYFDFSLRQHLLAKSDLLIKRLKGLQ